MLMARGRRGSAIAAGLAAEVPVDGARWLIIGITALNTATFEQKPTRTIRLGEAKIKAILDRLDEADNAAINSSGGGHYAYRAKSAALVRMQQPGGGSPAMFHCPTRYINNSSLGCLHGGYVHPRTRCSVQLFTTHGTWKDLDGVVDACTHVDANVHELCIRFDDEIDPGQFCPTAVRHRILLIEESTSLARLAIHDLQALNAEIEHVTDGRKGVETALKNNYDLVLLDVELSDMDGLEAVREMRKEGYTGTLVAFTARSGPEEQKLAVEAGFDMHVDKPYKRQDMSRLLEGLMEEPIYSNYQADPQMTDLLKTFVEELPGEVRAMRLAGIHRDAERLAYCARSMKASAGSYGFDILADAAAKITEALAQGRSAADVEILVAELVKLTGQVRA